MMRKYLLIAMALVLMSSVAWAEDAELPTSGECGTDCYWSFDEATNTLKITGNSDGTGVMDDYDYGSWTGTETRPEWYGYRDIAQNIVVEGVTNIGRCAFMNFVNVTSLEMDDSVTKLVSDDFYQIGKNAGTSDVRLSENLDYISGQSFLGLYVQNLVLPESLTNLSGVRLYGIHVDTLVLPSTATVGKEIFRNSATVNHLYCTGAQMQGCIDSLANAKIDIEPTRYEKTSDGVMVYDNQGRIVGKYADKNALGAGTVTETYKYDSAGHLVGIFDGNGQRTWGKKIYTVEEAMEATKDGDKFHVYLTYK